MNTAQRTELAQRMRREIEELRAVIQDMESKNAPVAPDASIGRLSRLDSMINQGIAQKSLGNARDRLRKLEAALEHIDDEDFGICAECGEPIPMGRLLALPESDLCVECAE